MTGSEEGRLNPSSPAGQVDSVGEFALALTRLTGWRRQLVRWVVIALLGAPLVVVVVGQLVH